MPAEPSAGGAPELISVVVPVLDEEEHIAEQLAALAGQTHTGRWELVVVDNGSTDRSMELVAGWRDRLPAVTVADASDRRGLNHARNVGARAARGDFLAFCDADDVVAQGWLAALAAAAPHSEIVAGALDYDLLGTPAVRELFFWSPPTALAPHQGFLPYAPGGNCGVWASRARDVGWDESFRFGSSDIEFCWRAQLAGHRIGFAPDAVVHQRLTGRMTRFARQFYAYGKSEPQLFRRFRAAGLRRAPEWRVLVVVPWLIRHLPGLLSDRRRRGEWVRTAAYSWGRAVGWLRIGAPIR